MGCGKSTLGRKLAQRLNLCFIDLDKYIEERNFRTIPAIFAEEGEDGFRQREKKALEEIADFENLVVATGGGAPCFFENIDLMNRTGVTLYLAPPVDILVERLLKSKNERPLIKGKSREELTRFIDENLQKRATFYEKASVIIRDKRNLEVDDVLPYLDKHQ
ncbi:shikimate kinase [Prolixibacter bellariivorans]|uniref:Shikimate kinase n=2 Tax=Prolixibacter bellariivorans TaxID=314319 RepID=A0A5M4AZA4_9BACT|nr:shikimate kinase [Prolixibacter bellariivorans]